MLFRKLPIVNAFLQCRTNNIRQHIKEAFFLRELSSDIQATVGIDVLERQYYVKFVFRILSVYLERILATYFSEAHEIHPYVEKL